MATPHDALFKMVFSQPLHAASELRGILPPLLADAADWSTLEPLPGSFVDPAEPGLHVDVLYRVQLRSRPALLHVILEHKSSVDRWTALQVADYGLRVSRDYQRRHPELARLPPVIAVVVYHGEKGWTRATGTLELFDLDESLRSELERFVPRMEFVLDDLSRESAASLSARTSTALARLTLLCLQLVREGAPLVEVLRRLSGAFRAAAVAPDTGSGLISVLSYIAQVRDLSWPELRDLVLTEIGPELKSAMTSTYHQLLNQGRAEGRAEGHAEGHAEGRAEGRIEGQAELLLEQLRQRFGPPSEDLVRRVRAADASSLRRWATRVLDAKSLDDVLAES